MNKICLFISSFIVVTVIGCVPLATATPTPEVFIARTQAIPLTLAPNETPTTPSPSFEGVAVSYEAVSLVLPSGLANGISGEQLPRAVGADVPTWGITPGHAQLTLEGYFLQGKFHEPQLFVYPASAYAELHTGAAENLQRLQAILDNPAAPMSAEQLPTIPFFNAQQVFASNLQVVAFQNGQGVRSLTEYGQYPAPANNVELFYHFQGLTDDGAYYVIAILPITAPGLGDSSDPTAATPIGGIAYPNLGDSDADWQGYYAAAVALLNATAAEAFAPTLNQLDWLIQSVRIAPSP